MAVSFGADAAVGGTGGTGGSGGGTGRYGPEGGNATTSRLGTANQGFPGGIMFPFNWPSMPPNGDDNSASGGGGAGAVGGNNQPSPQSPGPQAVSGNGGVGVLE